MPAPATGPGADPVTPAATLPDSGPGLPTISDASEPPRVSLQIPPIALLLPVAALALYWLIANRPALPQGESRLDAPAAVTRAADATETHPPGAPDEERLADGSGPAEHGTADSEMLAPAQSPAVVAVNIAELERTREEAQRAAQQREDARARVKVVLYTNERCTRCVEARTYLVAQGIHPVERDIDKDPRARARHRALSRKGGLPTIEVDGKVLVGFQPERLDKSIERATNVRLQRKR